MIKYALQCLNGHGFEAWFSSSTGYDNQVKALQVSCPYCQTTKVGKAIMAPAVIGGRRHLNASEPHSNPKSGEGLGVKPEEMIERAKQFRAAVEANCDYVGKDFATEARDMHVGLIHKRPIYGEASLKEVKALQKDGIPVLALPSLTPDMPMKKLN